MNGKDIVIFASVAAILLSLGYILDRWLNPWLANRRVEKLLRDVKEGKHSPSQNQYRDYASEIIFGATGFQLASLKQKDQKPIFISWNEVAQITAFKRDLFTVDCICLMIKTMDSKGVEFDEDMKGWSEFTDAMEKFLPGSKPFSEWFFQVAHPAFETNPTEIFFKGKITMTPVTRKRILLLAIFLFPIVVMALFFIFGKSPQDPAATLPLIPPH